MYITSVVKLKKHALKPKYIIINHAKWWEVVEVGGGVGQEVF